MLAHKTSTFDDSRAIRVLVVPIGEKSLLDFHLVSIFILISQLCEVPLSELSKPSQWNPNVNNGFRHFEWYNRGSILFEYLRYERVPNGPETWMTFKGKQESIAPSNLLCHILIDKTIHDMNLRKIYFRKPADTNFS